uniref:SAM domain-containing protein n=1 Tax=Macrostomum lignano TaxID=282301 RepID=A0A1I8FS34_9PLAT
PNDLPTTNAELPAMKSTTKTMMKKSTRETTDEGGEAEPQDGARRCRTPARRTLLPAPPPAAPSASASKTMTTSISCRPRHPLCSRRLSHRRRRRTCPNGPPDTFANSFRQSESKPVPPGPVFHEHDIDGKALLLLSSDMMMKYMGVKLGPALKLLNCVEKAKRRLTAENRQLKFITTPEPGLPVASPGPAACPFSALNLENRLRILNAQHPPLLVRYLSKRFIETYQSGIDILYSTGLRAGQRSLACLSWADSFLFVLRRHPVRQRAARQTVPRVGAHLRSRQRAVSAGTAKERRLQPCWVGQQDGLIWLLRHTATTRPKWRFSAASSAVGTSHPPLRIRRSSRPDFHRPDRRGQPEQHRGRATACARPACRDRGQLQQQRHSSRACWLSGEGTSCRRVSLAACDHIAEPKKRKQAGAAG